MRASSNGIGQRSCSASARSRDPAAPSRSPPAARRRPRQRAETARLQGIRERSAWSSKRTVRDVGPVQRTDHDRRLDRVAVHAPDRRLPEVDAVEFGKRLGEVPVGLFPLTGRQRGEPDAPVPDHGHDRLVGSCELERRLDGLEPAGVRVDVDPPRAHSLGLHALLCERVGHAGREGLGLVPPSRPRLDDHAVEQDVRERGLVALVPRCLLGLHEMGSRTVEVVDIPEPLTELEDDPLVGGGRGSIALELECPPGGVGVEPLAEEEVGSHAGAQGGRDEARLGVGQAVEQCKRGARGGSRLGQVDRSCVHRDRRMAAGLDHRVAGVEERHLGKRGGCRLALPPIVDLGEREQRTCPQIAGLQLPPERLENL